MSAGNANEHEYDDIWDQIQVVKAKAAASFSTSSGDHTDSGRDGGSSDSDSDSDSNSNFSTNITRAHITRKEIGTSSGEHTDDHTGSNESESDSDSDCDKEEKESIHTDPEDALEQGDATHIIDLFDAAREGREQDVIRILETEHTLVNIKSPGPSALELDWLRSMIPQKGDTPLHYAARAGRLTTVMEMVRFIKGNSEPYSSVSLKLLGEGNSKGDTPLHMALKNKQVEVAAYLIKERPEVGYQVNNIGVSPLFLAIDQGYMDLVEDVFLRWPGNFVSDTRKQSLLRATKASLVHAAIDKRNSEILKKVLENLPTLIESTDTIGWKPLSYAAFYGYLDAVHHILSEFPDSVKKYDKDGLFPIHKAVGGGHMSIIKEMISRFPDTKFQVGRNGKTILGVARDEDKLKVFSYIRKLPGFKKILDLDDRMFNDKKMEHKC